MMTPPEPITFDLPGLPTILGQIWAGAGDTVLLVHGPGADLDCWLGLPVDLQTEGYRVIAIDLPGHGLSDDWVGEPDLVAALAGVGAMIRHDQPGKLFAIGIGEHVPVLDAVGPDAIVAVGPVVSAAGAAEGTAPVLILVGTGTEGASEAADRYFRSRRGWAVSSSFGGCGNGAEILQSKWAGHATEQTISFLRDYRTPTI